MEQFLYHVVVFKYKPEASEEQKKHAVEYLRKVGSGMPGVIHWDLREKAFSYPVSYPATMDFIWISVFKDEEGLEQYRQDPRHAEIRQVLQEMATWYVMDYYAEPTTFL